MSGKLFRPEQARLIAGAFARHGVEYLFIGKGAARNAENVDGFPVMSIRDIIASKRAAGRKRDLAELELLESFREVYEASKARRKS